MKQKIQPPKTNPNLRPTLDDVPVDGALGLLAYGDIGLVAWRDKRAKAEGPNWRKKLAEELKREEESLKIDTKEELPDARD